VPARRCNTPRSTLQALGQEGDAEEALGRRVVVRYRTGGDGAEIGREIRFLETIGEHVRVRECHLDPGPQRLARFLLSLSGNRQGRRSRRGFRGAPARQRQSRAPLLVIEALEFCNLSRRRLHRREELVHRVEVAQRLVVLDWQRQMGDGVAGFERHRGEVPHPMFLVAPKGLVENIAPIVDHGLEQTIFVECRAGRTTLGAAGIMQPVRAVPGLHAGFDKGRQASP
jgi:hypothetical protein